MIKRSWILTTLLLGPVCSALIAQPDLEPLRIALDRQAAHKSVQVRLRQKKRLPALRTPITNTGHLWLIPGKAFRWQLGDPLASTAIYDGNRVFLLNEKKKSAVSLSPSDRKVKPLLIMLGIGEGASFDSMMEAFKVTKVTNRGTHFTAVMRPTSGKLKRVITELSLQINLRTSFLERIEWRQRDGTTVLTEFFAPTFNKPIPQSTFSFRKQDYQWR